MTPFFNSRHAIYPLSTTLSHSLMLLYKGFSWEILGRLPKGRSSASKRIMGKGRAPCCQKVGLKKGPWTPAEDMRLIAYIQKFGHENWRALPKQAGPSSLPLLFLPPLYLLSLFWYEPWSSPQLFLSSYSSDISKIAS